MWKKLLALGCLILAAGLVFLLHPDWIAHPRARADAPTRAPNAPSTTFMPYIAQNFTLTVNPLWRFGADKVRRPIAAYSSLDIAYMRLGWYIDFSASANPELLYGMEYVPMVRMKQWKKLADGTPTLCCVGCAYLDPPAYSLSPSIAQIQAIASGRPGMMWIIGNEMERIDWGGLGGVCGHQDEMLPEMYAQVYHDVYTAIKVVDGSAQVSMGALVQPSPLRIKYLDRVWAEYTRLYGVTMPVDIWNIHVYVYNEQKNSWGADIPAGLTETVGSLYQIRDNKDFTKAAPMIENWRTWMKNNGQQNKPLMTPEYGVAMPEWVQDPPGTVTFSPAQIRDSYMYPSFNYFLNQINSSIGFPADGNRLIQRWAWWSIDYDDGECDPVDGKFYADNSGNLFYSGFGPTTPPTNCPYPAQSRSPFWDYWAQYVQALPAGATKPYAYTPAPAPILANKSPRAVATYKPVTATTQCSDDPALRARLLQALPSRETPEGQRAWINALSKMTAGTRLCLTGN
ncbi:MAG: hypothetical protein HZC40_19810 [Chloroflexi bacterium]|nr:hypothetical protein [Chloroflexota bacterium]